MRGFYAIGLMVAALLVGATIVWPPVGVAMNLVGVMFAVIIVFQLGFQAGVSYVILGIMLLGALVFILRKRVPVFRLIPQEIAAAGLAAFMALTLAYTPTPIYGGIKVQLFAAMCLGALIICRILGSTRGHMEKTLKVFAWVSVSVLVLYTVLFVLARQMMTENSRFTGGSSALILGWTSAAAIVATSYLIISHTMPWTKVVAGVAIFSGLIVVVATGSRGPFVGLVAGAALTFLGRRQLLWSLGSAVLLTIVFVVALYLGPAEGRERILTVFGGRYSFEETGRGELYKMGLDHYRRSPLFGGGVGSFADYRGWGDTITYPHNMFIEVAGETGTIGLVLLLITFAYCVRPMLRLRSKLEPAADAAKIIQWLFWVGLANAMVSFDISQQRALFASIGFLGAVRQWPVIDEIMEEDLLEYDLDSNEPYRVLDESVVGY
jgi:O-antigen ligase